MKNEKTLKQTLETIAGFNIDGKTLKEMMSAINKVTVETNEKIKKMSMKERKEFKKRLEWCLKYAEENNPSDNRKNEN